MIPAMSLFDLGGKALLIVDCLYVAIFLSYALPLAIATSYFHRAFFALARLQQLLTMHVYP